jgi:hypothetical protein
VPPYLKDFGGWATTAGLRLGSCYSYPDLDLVTARSSRLGCEVACVLLLVSVAACRSFGSILSVYQEDDDRPSHEQQCEMWRVEDSQSDRKQWIHMLLRRQHSGLRSADAGGVSEALEKPPRSRSLKRPNTASSDAGTGGLCVRGQ